MIEFESQTDFSLHDGNTIKEWIRLVAESYNKEVGELLFVFCTDEALHKINLEYLEHDTLTDIISFDYGIDDLLFGDIFISIDRVRQNAEIFHVSFEQELHRVIIHGVLHYCGLRDKTEEEEAKMRKAENVALELLEQLKG